MSRREAAIAWTRFGYGARPGDLDEVAHDPRGWLLAQLEDSRTPTELRGLRSTEGAARDLAMGRGDREERREMKSAVREQAFAEVAARARAAAESSAPFRERWVAHFSNHFTVGRKNQVVTALAGAYEREAIRPHALGRFADLLLATARHPAMLVYLDQAGSVGPRSRAGMRRDRGLNENYARELLELHTLGVDGGYDQGDVRELARLLTGWTVDRDTGRFIFRLQAHEPGSKTVLGTRYGEGETSGRRALRDLADHPATARHVARRLATHFLADQPNQASIDALARTFTRSSGDLRAVARTLIGLEEAWTAPTKVKTPWDFVVHALRLTPMTQDRSILRALKDFEQLPFTADSPEGWSDQAADWIGGDALLARITWCEAAGRALRDTDALALGEGILGPLLSRDTRRAMSRSSTPHAVLLASPDFQRR